MLLILGNIAAHAAEPAKNNNWESLYNGRDLAGWTLMHDASFVATNETLHLTGGLGWLRSDIEYGDFILELEWRATEAGYDSGIFIRAGKDGKPWPDAAFQINLAPAALGALVKGNRTVVPAENSPVGVGKWVKFRIEARGKKLSLTVDGENAWEYNNLEPATGFLGIEAENKAFEFRNIRLLRL